MWTSVGALVGCRLLAPGQVGLGGGESDLRPLELTPQLLEPGARRLHVVARDLEVVPGCPELVAGPAQRGRGTRGLLAGLVEVRPGVLDRVLGLALLVAQMLDVSLRQRGGGGAQDESRCRAGNGQAPAGGGGEESHREPSGVRGR